MNSCPNELETDALRPLSHTQTLPMKSPNEDAIGQIVELGLDLIDYDPKNRKEHDKDDLISLKDSIASEGLLQPIVVRHHPEKRARYMIIAGERRHRAHGLLKRDTIQARIVKHDPSAINAAGAARKRLVENMQREDLTPIEEARGYRELSVDFKMTHADIAKLAGVSQPVVGNALRLLDLPGSVQDLVQAGTLSRAHGISLARYKAWPKLCEFLAKAAIDQGISSKDLEAGIGYRTAPEIIKAKLGERLNQYQFPKHEIPPILLKDPDVVAFADGDVWCFSWARYQEIMKPINDAKKAETAKTREQHAAAKPTDKGEVIEKAHEYLAVLVPEEKLGKRAGRLVCLDSKRWNEITSAAREVVGNTERKVIQAAATDALALLTKAKTVTAAMAAILFSDQDTEFYDPPGPDQVLGELAKQLGIKCTVAKYPNLAKIDSTQLIKLQIGLRLEDLKKVNNYMGDSVNDIAELLCTALGRDKLNFLDETVEGRQEILAALCQKLKIPPLLLPKGSLPLPAPKKAKKGGKAK